MTGHGDNGLDRTARPTGTLAQHFGKVRKTSVLWGKREEEKGLKASGHK